MRWLHSSNKNSLLPLCAQNRAGTTAMWWGGGGLKGRADEINGSDLVQQFILLLNSWIINYELWAFVCRGDFLSLKSKEYIKFEII